MGGSNHYHPAPTFSVPQRTFADKYKKKYTLSRDDTEINDVTSMAGRTAGFCEVKFRGIIWFIIGNIYSKYIVSWVNAV